MWFLFEHCATLDILDFGYCRSTFFGGFEVTDVMKDVNRLVDSESISILSVVRYVLLQRE